jgi:hypothetical protein
VCGGVFLAQQLTLIAGVVTTFAGNSGSIGGFFDGSGTSSYFIYPSAIAADSLGNVYVGDRTAYTIRKISAG